MNGTGGQIDVLYVDEPDATRRLSDSLEAAEERITVRSERTVADGLAALAAEPIDCIIAEYDLPDRTGIEFLTSVRDDHGDLPFVLYTENGSEQVASEAISAGVTDYLRKEPGTDQSVMVANKIRNAVEAQRAERERRRQLDAIESAQEGISILDSDGQYIYVNEAYADLYGYTREEMHGEHWELVYQDEDVAEIRDSVLETVERQGYWEGTTTGLRADGTTFVEDHVLALTDNGELVCTVRDITDRTERERELERTRDLLDQTERIADVGGWEIDTETMEVFWTDHLFEIIGREGSEEPPLEDALEVYYGSDKQVVEEAVNRALETGEPFDVEVRFERSDGELRWLHVQGTPTVEDGEVTTLRGAVKDVTERKAREEVLREMYEIISDREQTFEEQVRSLLDLGRRELGTQYGTLSQIHGDEYLFEIVAGEDDRIHQGDQVPLEATNCERVAETEETVVLGDVAEDAPEETERAGYQEMGICSYIGAPVHVNDEVYGTFCFYDTETRTQEFSEWEQTLVDLMSRWASHELERSKTTEQLEAKNEQLEQFASIVSHDLRNPLNVASLRLELAMDECDSDHLREVEQAHGRMKQLIEDLLDLALEGETVDETIPVTLESLVDHCRQHVDTRGGRLTVLEDRTLEADESRLQQLFENLVRNSVEHGTPNGRSGAGATAGGETEGVSITVGPLADGFYVEDDGPGIDPEDRENIFEPGFSTSDDGTGFGLSIVEQVATAHGWEVAVTESSTGGARFEITGVEFVED
ncbi:PAS domain S-box protein [Halovenus sp. WSH3]|uniref:histidine kinase n=1 Tax=Halovenus carboxidivorans TaxID=2692199 RepID=A0A6B0TBR8_9EURY|nr:PAS domain S-box protein [Halovenus carboxidivorans]MXR52340.1 PAS domain S-box protein [Halovenus carboxidivorans]